MPRAGRMRDRITFQRHEDVADGMGGRDAGWRDLFTVWGELRPERGRERVEAGRVSERTAGVLVVRSSVQTRGLTAADRFQDAAGAIYQIRSVTDPARRRRELEITFDDGAATGD